MSVNSRGYKRFGTALSVLTAAVLATAAITGVRADEVVVGHLSIVPVESIKAAVPHKVKLSEKKPASITAEPVYRGTPMYGVLTLGSSKKAGVPLVLDTFPGDKLPRLYVDTTGTGDLTGKAAFFVLKPLTSFATDATRTVAAVAAPKPDSGVPIGTMTTAVARYDIKGVTQDVKCPVLFTLLGDELDYSISVQHIGSLTAGGQSYKIALVDANASEVFDAISHADDKPANVKLMIDRNNDGKFDPVKEAFDLAKPFRLAGTAYEVASVDPLGTIIALQTTTKRPEGTITPDELAIGTDSIDFVAKTMDGRAVNFPSSYKHRIVMLDFWATWCGPCVAEIPNIVQVYNQYHKYGFDILGVSLDRANMADKVTSFCQQAGMTWPQIYDGKYWNAEIAKLYGIDSIPRAFLIDGDTGTILAMADAIRGPGLEPAITKALRKKGLLR